MQSLTRTATVDGTEAVLVTIECTTTSGFAGMQLVGNISDLCRDGKERAKTVLENLGFKMGHKRILINFSPAHCRKEGNHFDLPIAISLAALTGTKELAHDPKDWLFAAELGLDGSLRPATGIVPLILTAIDEGLKGVVIAEENAAEMLALREVAKLHDSDFQFLCFKNLEEVLFWLCDGVSPQPVRMEDYRSPVYEQQNFDDMYLDDKLKRIAVCFATGGHSLLLRGTPGAGKSMFAQRLPSLLPLLSSENHLDALRIHSMTTNKLSKFILQGNAPFRQPHHSTHPFALLGTADQPGELSLAHGGVLFLDEILEFRRDLLESLREPLETGKLHVSRAQKKVTWKSKVQLVAACNNCPCGFYDSKSVKCKCGMQKILNYEAKMSGPLLERIDMHHRMQEMSPELFSENIPKHSSFMKNQVISAREYMFKRWGQETENSASSFEQILESSQVTGKKRAALMKELAEYKLSSRSILRLLRVARTLADIDQSLTMEKSHIKEAANLRPQSS